MKISSWTSTGRPSVPRRPRVSILCDYFPPSSRAGGPSRSILGIVRHEFGRADITVITRNHDIHSKEPYNSDLARTADSLVPGVAVNRVNRSGQYRNLWKLLRSRAKDTDLIYINSLHSPTYSIYPLLLLRFHLVPNRAVLLAPRGELSPGALAIKPTKKRLAAPVLRHLTRHLDVTWHASSEHEAGDIRRFVGLQPTRVIIRANPAPIAACPPPPPPDNEILTISFVARMAPIKNFKLLARGVGIARVPIRLVVAGTLEDHDYWSDCRKLLDRLGHHIIIDICGHLADDAVSELLKRSDAMVLPTRGENFGRSIAEALSVGCPVMIPPTTLWTPLVQRGAGWLIDEEEPLVLAQALRALAAMSPTERSSIRIAVLSEYAHWWRQNQREESLFMEAAAISIPRFEGFKERVWGDGTNRHRISTHGIGPIGRGTPDNAP